MIYLQGIIALFNGFLWTTVDYDSRQIIITRDAVEGDNELNENHKAQRLPGIISLSVN